MDIKIWRKGKERFGTVCRERDESIFSMIGKGE